MDKKIRQYIGIIVAIAFYYIIHEGAHLVTALCLGVFRRINFLGLGVQIGIKLLIPEIVARTGFGILFIINVLIFVKYILPMYKKAFEEETDS